MTALADLVSRLIDSLRPHGGEGAAPPAPRPAASRSLAEAGEGWQHARRARAAARTAREPDTAMTPQTPLGTSALVLIVEDEPEIAVILARYLEAAGYRTASARDGEQALVLARTLRPDLMLLDLNIPARDGFQVLTQLRRDGQMPVIVVSAMGEDDDKLSALRMGADDFVTKPFNPKEVVARVAAVLRRLQPPGDAPLRLANIALDPMARRVSVGGRDVALTDSEFRLLHVFLRQPARAFSRAELLDGGLEDSQALERTVDSHISHLRRKLTEAGSEVRVNVVRGFGYRLGA